jgi:hypothetical protein
MGRVLLHAEDPAELFVVEDCHKGLEPLSRRLVITRRFTGEVPEPENVSPFHRPGHSGAQFVRKDDRALPAGSGDALR